MGFVDLISNLLGAVKAVFGYQTKKLELKNAAPVQAAAAAQAERDEIKRSEDAVGKKDVNEIRNELGE